MKEYDYRSVVSNGTFYGDATRQRPNLGIERIILAGVVVKANETRVFDLTSPQDYAQIFDQFQRREWAVMTLYTFPAQEQQKYAKPEVQRAA